MDSPLVFIALVVTVLLPASRGTFLPDLELLGSSYSEFECNSYQYLAWKLDSLLDTRAAWRYQVELLDDGRITNSEMTELLQIYCRSVKDADTKAEESYRSCSNVQQIRQTMTHLGPFCTSSGTFSTFLTGLLANFTEIRTTLECERDVTRIDVQCQASNVPSIPEVSFEEDQAELKRMVKEKFQCAVDELQEIHSCGNPSDTQICFLLWEMREHVNPGFDYKVSDFF